MGFLRKGLIFFCMYTGLVSAVSQDYSVKTLKSLAVAEFEAGNYKEALEDFEKLMLEFPQDVSLNYYLGRCYLEQNQNQEKAMDYLKYAASQNYKPDVHYFLAKACYNQYQFEQAGISANNFKKLAKKKEIKKLKPEILIASIKSAWLETREVESIYVKRRQKLTNTQIRDACNNYVTGKFISTPEDLLTIGDKKNNFQGTMYVPLGAQKDTLIYFSGFSRRKKGSADIFVVSENRQSGYSYPKSVVGINSIYQEDYAYFDKTTHTLYFSSDRIEGLGGYDIYKAVYHKEGDYFEKPQRLDFPINSPFDDFFYIPVSHGNSAVFISNRNNKAGEYTSYLIDLSGKGGPAFLKSAEEIRGIAALPVREKLEEQMKVVEKQPVAGSVGLSGYDLKIRDAMDYQLKCDSLQGQILSDKILLRSETGDKRRKVLFSAIAKSEREIKEYQKLADSLFIEAYGMHPDEPSPDHVPNERVKKDSAEDPFIQVGKVKDDLKIYTFPTGYHGMAGNNPQGRQNTENDIADSTFSIGQNSPYSEEKPIPRDYKLPDGLIYRIQLGAFSQNLPADNFGGLFPMMAEELDAKKLTKYYVGIFKTSKKARTALRQVKSYGYTDAFIVPYYNQEKIAIQAAREIEFGEKK
jgi:tetratricopeptide (TPR) repeat protein